MLSAKFVEMGSPGASRYQEGSAWSIKDGSRTSKLAIQSRCFDWPGWLCLTSLIQPPVVRCQPCHQTMHISWSIYHKAQHEDRNIIGSHNLLSSSTSSFFFIMAFACQFRQAIIPVHTRSVESQALWMVFLARPAVGRSTQSSDMACTPR
jgi:hypothetical protein